MRNASWVCNFGNKGRVEALELGFDGACFELCCEHQPEEHRATCRGFGIWSSHRSPAMHPLLMNCLTSQTELHPNGFDAKVTQSSIPPTYMFFAACSDQEGNKLMLGEEIDL